MSKNVKVKAIYASSLVTLQLWGVPFLDDGEGNLIAEIPEDQAKEMIELGRVELFTASKVVASEDNTVDFASQEAGELNAKLVADKVLTAKEFKKITGTGVDKAITVGDIEDYIASKAPVAPPPPAAVK